MLKEEIIKEFKHRNLNSKTNNFIFSGIDDFKFLNDIPDRCSISTPENDIDIEFAYNIKIDLSEVNVRDIISYTLDILKNSSLLDVTLDYNLKFNNKFDLFRFQNVLHNYGIVVQLIFYNLEELELEEWMLFNEIYYFNSIFFNANAFIHGDNFETYFITNERVLDNRENYTKIKSLDKQVNDKKQKDLVEEKKIIKNILLHAYVTAGAWCFSLADDEIESYMDGLKRLFENNKLTTHLFVKDENNKYTMYKNYILSLFGSDDASLGYYNEESNEVCFDRNFDELIEMYEIFEDFSEDFFEYGSYYLTEVADVFASVRKKPPMKVIKMGVNK